MVDIILIIIFGFLGAWIHYKIKNMDMDNDQNVKKVTWVTVMLITIGLWSLIVGAIL